MLFSAIMCVLHVHARRRGRVKFGVYRFIRAVTSRSGKSTGAQSLHSHAQWCIRWRAVTEHKLYKSRSYWEVVKVVEGTRPYGEAPTTTLQSCERTLYVATSPSESKRPQTRSCRKQPATNTVVYKVPSKHTFSWCRRCSRFGQLYPRRITCLDEEPTTNAVFSQQLPWKPGHPVAGEPPVDTVFGKCPPRVQSAHVEVLHTLRLRGNWLSRTPQLLYGNFRIAGQMQRYANTALIWRPLILSDCCPENCNSRMQHWFGDLCL